MAIPLRVRGLLGLALLVLSPGCRTLPPAPPVDLTAPGWTLLRGQAEWHPPQHRPEIAGELILATNRSGDFLVQFSKIPFPIVTAQTTGNRWQIEFGAGEHAWAGAGPPPRRWLWFQLPPGLAQAPLAAPWQFETLPDGRWRIFNPRTGEALEGGFFP